jgi:hypothetical protein
MRGELWHGRPAHVGLGKVVGMPDPIDYGRPDAICPELRSLLIGGGVQLISVILAASCLDEGELVLNATCRVSAAYWCGVILVMVRRANRLTKGDHRYFRFGLMPLLLVGVPLTNAIWLGWIG